MKEHSYHIVGILDAGNPEKIDLRCTCEKKTKNRDLQGVWHEDILEEWKLIPPTPKDKYRFIATCPHVAGIDLNLRETFRLRIFGFRDGLDSLDLQDEYPLFPLKPYLFIWADTLSIAPEFPDYVFDYAFTYHSSMFKRLTREVNEKIRRTHGLRDLSIYSDHRMKNYIMSRFVEEGISGKKLDEIIELVEKI